MKSFITTSVGRLRLVRQKNTPKKLLSLFGVKIYSLTPLINTTSLRLLRYDDKLLLNSHPKQP